MYKRLSMREMVMRCNRFLFSVHFIANLLHYGTYQHTRILGINGSFLHLQALLLNNRMNFLYFFTFTCLLIILVNVSN